VLIGTYAAGRAMVEVMSGPRVQVTARAEILSYMTDLDVLTERHARR
jgi:hypothetical protein